MEGLTRFLLLAVRTVFPVKCFSVQNASKTAFYFALFSCIFFPSSHFDYPTPCPLSRHAHSRLLYEGMSVITIGSGNCNLSPSQSTTASVAEVGAAGQPSSAEVMTKHKESDFETKEPSL